ncbi:DNA polymerase III subunit epsilon [Buchnera aphidicola]|uniref:DNA polymerase III subunit epsilon n=1 Tax=Buchnera aphidicola TaxID=9 RepID=UPI0034638EDB
MLNKHEKKNNRQIVLDTETTGINKKGKPYLNHRIIEIGAVEILNRKLTNNKFHVYIKPDRKIDDSAFKIHGISNKFLLNKPSFRDIYKEFLKYINGSDLIIHNAPFDIGFLNNEFRMLKKEINKIENLCNIIDSLTIARKIFPGKKNSLDALCNRYNLINIDRNIHSAIIDAEILAEIYLIMTSRQNIINFEYCNDKKNIKNTKNFLNKKLISFKVIKANLEESILHKEYLNLIFKNNKICLWKKN